MFHPAISFIFQNQVHLLYTMHSERQLMYCTTSNELLSLIGLRLTGPSCDKTTQDSSLHSNWQIDIDMHMYMRKCCAQMKMTYLCQPQEQWQVCNLTKFLGTFHSIQSKRCFHITCFHTNTVLSGLVSFCLSQVKWRHKGLYLTSLAVWCLLLC